MRSNGIEYIVDYFIKQMRSSKLENYRFVRHALYLIKKKLQGCCNEVSPQFRPTRFQSTFVNMFEGMLSTLVKTNNVRALRKLETKLELLAAELAVCCGEVPPPTECTPVTFPSQLMFADSGIVGEEYSYSYQLSGSTPFGLNIISKPDWADVIISLNFLYITGLPNLAQTESVQLEVSNCEDTVFPVEFQFVIEEQPECVPVAVDPPEVPTAFVGIPYNFSFPVTGSQPINLGVINQPDWATVDFDGTEVTISGIPTVEGTDSFDLVLNNCVDISVPITIEIVVEPPPPCVPIVITDSLEGVYVVYENIPFHLEFQLNPDRDLSQGNSVNVDIYPPWMTFEIIGDVLHIDGTPEPANPFDSDIVITLENACGQNLYDTHITMAAIGPDELYQGIFPNPTDIFTDGCAECDTWIVRGCDVVGDVAVGANGWRTIGFWTGVYCLTDLVDYMNNNNFDFGSGFTPYPFRVSGDGLYIVTSRPYNAECQLELGTACVYDHYPPE